jgi:hypothetical protein
MTMEMDWMWDCSCDVAVLLDDPVLPLDKFSMQTANLRNTSKHTYLICGVNIV